MSLLTPVSAFKPDGPMGESQQDTEGSPTQPRAGDESPAPGSKLSAQRNHSGQLNKIDSSKVGVSPRLVSKFHRIISEQDSRSSSPTTPTPNLVVKVDLAGDPQQNSSSLSVSTEISEQTARSVSNVVDNFRRDFYCKFPWLGEMDEHKENIDQAPFFRFKQEEGKSNENNHPTSILAQKSEESECKSDADE